MLSCSVHGVQSGHSHGAGSAGTPMTSPQCRANDTAFLTTLAWCIHIKCADKEIPISKLQAFWEQETTGDPGVSAKWDYPTALYQVKRPPTRELKGEDTLNFTALPPEAGSDIQVHTLAYVTQEESVHAIYGIVIIVVGFGLPVLLTWMNYLPFMTGIIDRIKPYLVYPAIIGTYQVRPLPYLLGNAPTVGQSLYVAVTVILNIVLSAVNYKTTQPNAWSSSTGQEVLTYVMWRTGFIGFALAPLVILFSGRNNILLWLTNWSHATYMLLHRWVARIFGIQVILHSVLGLALYIDNGGYPAVEKRLYWIWGSVATVATCVSLIFSGLYFIRQSYEIFLILHILMAVFIIVGCWYHVVLEFGMGSGFQQWMYAACAVWFFDRLIRVFRILKNGIRRGIVTDIGEGFVRVDIDGIRWSAAPGRHVYAYFPTLNPLKPWENHPFSVLPTAMLYPSMASTTSSAGDSDNGVNADIEKHEVLAVQSPHKKERNPTTGLTLFIKKSTGMTKYLKAHEILCTLLDGPYPNNPTGPILQCDRLLLIGGGIGITGLVPWVKAHCNIKLYWSVKESANCLVQSLDDILSTVGDKDIRTGQRLDVNALLAQEVETGWTKVGVVVCGPGGLCDDVRAAVSTLGRNNKKTTFELEVDAYSW